jgi:hypothetical protein
MTFPSRLFVSDVTSLVGKTSVRRNNSPDPQGTLNRCYFKGFNFLTTEIQSLLGVPFKRARPMLTTAQNPLKTGLNITYRISPCLTENSSRPPESLILLREEEVARTSSADLHTRQESVLPQSM